MSLQNISPDIEKRFKKLEKGLSGLSADLLLVKFLVLAFVIEICCRLLI
jgi:hypothetical protein